jgi:hypothetical protein
MAPLCGVWDCPFYVSLLQCFKCPSIYVFFFFFRRYNFNSLNVSAFSTYNFQFLGSWMQLFQFFIFSFFLCHSLRHLPICFLVSLVVFLTSVSTCILLLPCPSICAYVLFCGDALFLCFYICLYFLISVYTYKIIDKLSAVTLCTFIMVSKAAPLFMLK